MQNWCQPAISRHYIAIENRSHLVSNASDKYNEVAAYCNSTGDCAFKANILGFEKGYYRLDTERGEVFVKEEHVHKFSDKK